MATYKLVLGFTDVWDEEGFKTVKEWNLKDGEVNYNLYRQNPDIEKQTLTWNFMSERPAVIKLLKYWENLIRIPHLEMVNKRVTPHPLNPDFESVQLGIFFKNLIPFEFDTSFEDEDYGYVQHGSQFGDISVNYHQLVPENINRAFTLNNAMAENNFDSLKPMDWEYELDFNLNFNFSEHTQRSDVFGMSDHQINWMKEHEEILKEHGYEDIHDKKYTIGSYTIARMGSPMIEAYETIKNNPYVCRISIIEE